VRRWFLHPWLTLRAPLALGAVFLAAALPKIADPPAFAKAIWAYRLFPGAGVHAAALLLPWLELLCGLALILGVKVREAASWTMVLLLAFLLSLSVDLARGVPVDCGCFGPGHPQRTREERLAAMRLDLLRDLGLLLLALQVLAANGTRKSTEQR
jgi:uncharacterized membrane protein YphA (DoxX/SURF4 family)